MLAHFREFFAYRGLLWLLSSREIKIRYRNTALGLTWVLLQPAALITVYWIVFGVLFHMRQGPVQYLPFIVSGIIPWMAFANGFSRATTILQSNRDVVLKIAFPREIFPIAAVMMAGFDLCIMLGVAVPFLGFNGFWPSWRWLLLPLVGLGIMALAAGLGLLAAAVSILFRDMSFIIPLFLQVGFFATPVLYSVDMVPPVFQQYVWVNPMSVYVETARGLLTTGDVPPGDAIAGGAVLSAVIFLTCYAIFKWLERFFPDVI